MPVDHIEDGENLYRRIPNDPSMFPIADGKQRFSTTVFNSPDQKPSVDRAKLRNNPSETKRVITDGVISLLTADVRKISIVNTSDILNAPKVYSVNVISRPICIGNLEGLPVNEAHAQIETDPILASSSRFKKLKEALAYLASQNDWTIKPS